MLDKILIVGSGGQIGSELVESLRKKYGCENVIASDIKELQGSELQKMAPYESLNILDKNRLFEIVKKHKITQIYLLAALLSATAEKNPMFAWDLNMNGLFNVLELAKEKHLNKVYWPSSIAVFGPTTPRLNTPQYTVMEPNTVYGISKQAGERWCEYYFNKYQVDVRSLRYPGLIGYKSAPGGGTTDYAVHIFYEALKNSKYTCFLNKDTALPMMYMEDAINATISLMETDSRNVKIRSSYNLAGVSFTPEQVANEIKKYISNFEISYQPDFRQQIADSWPASIDDSFAKKDWAWVNKFSFEDIVTDMLKNLKKTD